MLNNKHKLYNLLEVISDILVITPNDSPMWLDPKGDLKGIYSQEELNNMLRVLQEEKVLKVTQFPSDGEIRFTDTETDFYYRLSVTAPVFNEYFSKVQKELDVKPKTQNVNGENNTILKITYTPAREILINDFFLLAKPDLESENDLVFNFLYNHPHKKHTLDEIAQEIKNPVTKTTHKIVENLGFKGELRKIFMDVTKTSICFKNPITKEELSRIGITRMKLSELL